MRRLPSAYLQLLEPGWGIESPSPTRIFSKGSTSLLPEPLQTRLQSACSHRSNAPETLSEKVRSFYRWGRQKRIPHRVVFRIGDLGSKTTSFFILKGLQPWTPVYPPPQCGLSCHGSQRSASSVKNQKSGNKEPCRGFRDSKVNAGACLAGVPYGY